VIPEDKVGVIVRKGHVNKVIQGPKRRFIIPFYDRMLITQTIENITFSDVQIQREDLEDIVLSMDLLYEIIDLKIYVNQARDSKEALKNYFIFEANIFFNDIEMDARDEVKWQLKEYFSTLTEALEGQYHISFKALELSLH